MATETRRQLTDAEKIRRLPWGIAADANTTVFGYLTVFGTPFILMLGVLGLPKTQIGTVLALFPFFQVISLVAAPWVARFGFKRAFLLAWALRYATISLLLLTPWVVEQYGVSGAFYFIAAVIAGFGFCRALGETAAYPWSQEIVPDSVRAKYIAVNMSIANTVGALSIAIAGWVIGANPTLQPFMTLLAFGVGFGLLGMWCMAHLPGGESLRDHPGATSMRRVWDALRDQNFRWFLAAMAAFTLINGPGSFIPLYLEEQVGLNPGIVVWLQIAGLTGMVTTGFFWGWAADRYGGKPVVLTALPAAMLMPVLWFMIPRHSEWSAMAAASLHFVGAVIFMGWWVGVHRLLFVRLVPRELKTQYMAVHYAWLGLMGGLAPLLAGWALDQLRDLSGHLGRFVVDQYSPLWAANMVFVLLTILAVSRIRVVGELGVRQFTTLFVQGNPLLAVESLVRYGLAISEETRLSITEMMGRAKSPLNVEELIHTLHDPSFTVRHEAIVALAHMKPQPRIVEGLAEVLRGRQPDLGVAAAWALARLGDRRALEPLREALDSDFPMVQAASARALGRLGDTESAPLLLERLRRLHHAALRTPYAAALGSLRYQPALPELLEFLRAPSDSAEELALAVARLIGGERRFLGLWRQMRAGTGPGAEAAVRAWRGKLTRLEDRHPELRRATDACARAFLADRMEEAVELLRGIITELLKEALPDPLPTVLREADTQLERWGVSYREWLLLALHAAGVAIRYLISPPPGGRAEDLTGPVPGDKEPQT